MLKILNKNLNFTSYLSPTKVTCLENVHQPVEVEETSSTV